MQGDKSPTADKNPTGFSAKMHARDVNKAKVNELYLLFAVL